MCEENHPTSYSLGITCPLDLRHMHVGDRVTSLVSSGGYAEYATADANAVIPIPPAISFAEATTIAVQGVSAYCLLNGLEKPQW